MHFDRVLADISLQVLSAIFKIAMERVTTMSEVIVIVGWSLTKFWVTSSNSVPSSSRNTSNVLFCGISNTATINECNNILIIKQLNFFAPTCITPNFVNFMKFVRLAEPVVDCRKHFLGVVGELE